MTPAPLDTLVPKVVSLSFDCYGTLIDWVSGIRGVFDRLADSVGALDLSVDEFFDTYLEAEAEAERGPYVSYRDVLTCVQARLSERFGLQFAADQANVLADSLAAWMPYPDTNDALRRLKPRFRLIILSNVDRDLFAATARHLAVDFDAVITAEDVGAYKPAHAHFRRLLDTAVEAPETHIHVAQSLFHDGVPAAELDIPFIWINRRNKTNDTSARPVAVFEDLAGLADGLKCPK